MVSMSVAEAVAGRRSVREMSAQPVPAELLQRVATLAMEAPSSWNHQSRSMVIVTDAAVRENLVEATGGQPVVAAASALFVFVGELDEPTADRSAVHDAAISRGAWTRGYSRGSAKAAVRFQQDLKDRGLLREYAVKDAMISASFAMLAAQAEGLATAPMNGWDEEQVKKAIGIDDREDLAIALVMAVGYAHQLPVHPGRLSGRHIFDSAYGRQFDADTQNHNGGTK